MYFVFEDAHGRPGFKIDTEHEIGETDFYISDEAYEEFFVRQDKGASLRLKDPEGESFDELFEEYIPETPPEIIDEIETEIAKEQEINTLKTQVEELTQMVLELLSKTKDDNL